MRAIPVESADELQRFSAMAGATAPSTTADMATADEHWMVAGADGAPLARVSLWWNHVPPHGDRRTGLVGHYAACSDEAAAILLRAACERLHERGCNVAIGPMDGSTWHRYRFVVERGSEPLFFLDVDQPDAWPRQFERAGFRELARYSSSLNPDLARRFEREAEWAQRARDQGVTLRAIDAGRLEQELRSIYSVSCSAFARNFLYSPIDEETFLRMYRPVLPHIDPRLVLLAERERALVGFVFCIPDLLERERRGHARTIILKTFGVHPQAMQGGLGSHLAASAQRVAFELGYRRLIYAFMHDDNPSVRISAHYGPAIRRYALYSRELTG